MPPADRPPDTPTPSALICVFAKAPVPGRVNTRLIPSAGAEGAASLARAFLIDTLSSVARLDWAEPILASTGVMPADLELPARVVSWDQGAGDLGQRVEQVLARALDEAPAAIALGGDTPGLPVGLLEEARRQLAATDAVIGPAEDGGFYLLGLRRCPAGLLENLPWGVPDTFARTRERIRGLGLSVAVLPQWFDIDRPSDLRRLRRLLDTGQVHAPLTSTVLERLGIAPDLPAGNR